MPEITQGAALATRAYMGLANPYRRPASVPPPETPTQQDEIDPWRVALVVAWGLDLWRLIATLQGHETPWAELAVACLLVVLTALTLFWPSACGGRPNLR
jgi:hypothetical protein